jgi:hypothetical protein
MTSTSALPLLLPPQNTKTNNYPEWEPRRHLQPPQAPVIDDQRIQDLELAVQRQLLDGKALKKTRPRRTVDYAGGMGRWALVCYVSLHGPVSDSFEQFRKLQPNPRYVPYIRPSPPYIIDVRSINIYWVLADLLTAEHGCSFSLQKPTLTMPRHRSAQSSCTRPRTRSDVQ